ncbi:MAG: trigger factor, partial [Sphingobacteriales bacterium]
IGTLHDKITVKLTKEDYWPSFEKSLKQYAKQANVPGFRKGMVPAGMVRKMYGQSLFGDEVIRSASRQLEEYLNKEKVSIFAQPMILRDQQPVNLDMNNAKEVDFAFEIGVKPDFEVPALKNKTKLTRYKVAVSDKLVEDEVERTKKRYGKVEELELISSKDDILYITYELSDEAGNVAEDAAKTEDTVLMEKYPAKLQDKLMGMKKDATLVIRPSDIAEGDELKSFLKDPLKAGPDAADNYYRLTLTKVGMLIPRDLDAELFMQVFPNSLVKDADDFREKVREELSKEYTRISNERLQNEIFELLVHSTPIELPVGFLKRWLKEGQEKPKSEAEVEKEYPSMDHQLRWELISNKLIQEGEVKVSYDEVMTDIKGRVLAYFGMDADEEAPWMDSYMQKVTKDQKTMDETYRNMLYARLFQWLEGQFSVEEKEITEEEFFKLPNPHDAHHHHH